MRVIGCRWAVGGALILFCGLINLSAQVVYTPYAFTNFVGHPGGPGFADGVGVGARFRAPSGTAVDGAGNVYVVDQNNFCIRQITPSGTVTTIAGTPTAIGTNDGVGSLATFGSSTGGPVGIAVDQAGNLYVSDTENYTVRKLVFAGTNWVVSTLAGLPGRGGSIDGDPTVARFSGPTGLTTDAAGNVYVADGYTIRKVSPTGVVTTLAGNASQPGSTDGTNSAARFGTALGGPKGLTLDSGTNLYVADTYNSTIRQVSPSGTNWIVTTILGSAGGIGFTDGTNSVVRFDNPYGIALDKTGNMFVTDPPAQTVRRIQRIGADWVVTTLAGTVTVFGSADGQGNTATFQTPEGASVDAAGNVYVADFGNNAIRKITPGGLVSTIAGEATGLGTADGTGTAAEFYLPHGVALDSAGNLYISDTSNETIRKVTPGGVVTTIAGVAGTKGYVDGVTADEAARFNAPTAISSDSAGNLYVGDSGNQTVRKITSSAVVTTIAGQVGIAGSVNGPVSSATFHDPEGTTVDSAGNVYVADLVNRVIRKITPDGTVSTFAGTVAQQGTNDGVGSAARFVSPIALAIDSSNNLYVADQGGDTIRKILPDATVTTFAGKGKVSGTNDGLGGTARFTGPQGVAVDAAGNLYVTDSGNDTIRMITPAGLVSTLAGLAGQSGSIDGTNSVARFSTPRGIGVDSQTNIYVADSVSSTIRKLVLRGTDCIVTTLAGSAGQNGTSDGLGSAARFHIPFGLAVDSSNNVYVVDKSNDSVRRITPEGLVTTFAGAPGQAGSSDGTGGAALFYGPQELSVDSEGNVYVVEFFNNTVRKIAPSGSNWVVSTVAGCASCGPGTNDGAGAAARFSGPFGLTLDSSGNVYVADTGNHAIRKITYAAGSWTVSTFAGVTGQSGSVDGTGIAARFSAPHALAAGSAGYIYVTDGYAIRRISDGAAVTTLAGCPPPGCTNAQGSTDGLGPDARFGLSQGIAVDSVGNIYVADTSNNTIRKLTPSGGDWTVTTLGGVPGQASAADGVGDEARFNQPGGIAVDPTGTLYIVNSFENNIYRGVSTASPVTPLQFDISPGSLTISNGSFQIHLNGPANGSFVVDTSTNLQTWIPLQTNALPLLLSVPVGSTPTRFFRAHPAP